MSFVLVSANMQVSCDAKLVLKYISTSQPNTGSSGELWYNPQEKVLYIYVNNNWLPLARVERVFGL